MYKGGRTLKDSMPIIELLEQAGVDALDIDSGCYETMDYIFPTRYTGEACMAYVCEEARKHVNIPIINAYVVNFSPVSYTHLDVYKRQDQGIRRRKT